MTKNKYWCSLGCWKLNVNSQDVQAYTRPGGGMKRTHPYFIKRSDCSALPGRETPRTLAHTHEEPCLAASTARGFFNPARKIPENSARVRHARGSNPGCGDAAGTPWPLGLRGHIHFTGLMYGIISALLCWTQQSLHNKHLTWKHTIWFLLKFTTFFS